MSLPAAAPNGFEEWLNYTFSEQSRDIPDSPAAGTAATPSEPNRDVFILYFTYALENAASLFVRFSDAQLSQGLNQLISPSHSNAIHVLRDLTIAWPTRRRALNATYTLFKDVFAERCLQTLSHLNEPGGPLNPICYMWWDIVPIAPKSDAHSDLDREVLSIMGKTLRINHLACQEAALHGLGHWAASYAINVSRVIDNFLAGHSSLRPELRRYALAARAGRIQ